MPLHDWVCSAGHRATRFVKLADLDKYQECACGLPLIITYLRPPMMAVDIPAYQSPIDGKVINSRKQRKEDLKRNGCVEWEPGFNEETARNRQRAEAAEEKAIDSTVEEFIEKLPVRKKEQLDSELRSGADVSIDRL